MFYLQNKILYISIILILSITSHFLYININLTDNNQNEFVSQKLLHTTKPISNKNYQSHLFLLIKNTQKKININHSQKKIYFTKINNNYYKLTFYSSKILKNTPTSPTVKTINHMPVTNITTSNDFNKHNFWWLLLITLISGLGLNLTPCIYPLLPITIGFFGTITKHNRKLIAINAIAYWIGIATIYSTLGVIISFSGNMLGQIVSHPLVILALTSIMGTLAIAMFDIWELKLPNKINQLLSINHQKISGSFIMGISSGILATPCIGPFVLGLITHVASVGLVSYGIIIFLVFSIGLGLPLTILAFFSGLLNYLPKTGEWMIWVRRLFGVILILMAINSARPLMEDKVHYWSIIIISIIASVYMIFFERSSQNLFTTLKKKL